jgi:hypothetical protein
VESYWERDCHKKGQGATKQTNGPAVAIVPVHSSMGNRRIERFIFDLNTNECKWVYICMYIYVYVYKLMVLNRQLSDGHIFLPDVFAFSKKITTKNYVSFTEGK